MLNDQTLAALDLQRLSRSAGGDQGLMAELAALYISDTDEKLRTLETAVAAGAAAQSGELAHGIKGASAAVGAEAAVAAFRVLEDLGRAGQTTDLDEALCAARAAYERARERLRDTLGTRHGVGGGETCGS